jgi:hypothetical protein
MAITRRMFVLCGCSFGLTSARSALAYKTVDRSTENCKGKAPSVLSTFEQVSLHYEIQDLLARYCYAVDDRDWSSYRALFIADAIIDDTVTGGIKSGVEEHVRYLQRALSKILISQHAISNVVVVEVGACEARVRSTCSCPMVVDLGQGRTQVLFQGLWYHHLFVRAANHWRIKELREEGYWNYNVPVGFEFDMKLSE